MTSRHLKFNILHLTLILCAIIFTISTPHAEEPQPPFVENSLFMLRMIPRSPEQMIAFYEARGFPAKTREIFTNTCFITAVVRNKSQKVLWLELKYWRFYNEKGEIIRHNRDFWTALWQQQKLEQSNLSTFGWTLMPEVRDLQPNESVGGNIVLPRTRGSFNFEAVFVTEQNKRGSEIRVQFKDLQCLDNSKT